MSPVCALLLLSLPIQSPATSEKMVLAFRPTPGKVLEKDYEHVFLGDERRTILTDRYVALGERGVTELVRSFDRVTLKASGPSEEVWCALQQEQVRFAYDHDSEQHVASFVEPESARARGVDERQLGLLELDTDLVGFLPAWPVGVGDEWWVPAGAVRRVLDPGGVYVYDARDESLARRVGSRHAGGESDEEAHLRAKLVETTRLGGDRIAVIALSGELDFVSEFMEPVMLSWGGREAFAVDRSFPSRALMRYELKGTLRWNVDSGHADELVLAGDVRLLERLTTLEEARRLLADPYEPNWWPWTQLVRSEPSGYTVLGEVSVTLRVFC